MLREAEFGHKLGLANTLEVDCGQGWGKEACAPHDCLAVTVMAGSWGIQTAPSEGWGHS